MDRYYKVFHIVPQEFEDNPVYTAVLGNPLGWELQQKFSHILNAEKAIENYGYADTKYVILPVYEVI